MPTEVKEVYTIVKGGAKDFWQKISGRTWSEGIAPAAVHCFLRSRTRLQ